MLLFAFIAAVITFALGLVAMSLKESEGWMILVIPSFLVACGTGLIVIVGGVFSAFNHVGNLGVIRAQDQIITEYETHIERLDSRLEDFGYPDKSEISLDADTPWASIIESLDNAESQLTEARVERAKAQRSIETRKAGPYWFVVKIYGDE